MTSFTPLDLGDSGNVTRAKPQGEAGPVWPTGDSADTTVLDELPTGDCHFWGVPFNVVGPGDESGYVMVAGGDVPEAPEQVSISVGQAARRLLFAHVCTPIGGERTIEGASDPIGTYRIVYSDETTEEQQLRRRFEIHDVVIPWGHHPFLCRKCRHFFPLPPNEHPHGVTAGGSSLAGWWLYDWPNPHPDKVIERIELAAAEAAVAVLGAITLCDEEADPLHWPPRAEVAVTLDRDEASEAASMEVEMERGVVVRRADLLVPQEDYLTTDEAGWGRGGQEERDGYVEIHGSAEGELKIRTGIKRPASVGATYWRKSRPGPVSPGSNWWRRRAGNGSTCGLKTRTRASRSAVASTSARRTEPTSLLTVTTRRSGRPDWRERAATAGSATRRTPTSTGPVKSIFPSDTSSPKWCAVSSTPRYASSWRSNRDSGSSP